MLRFLIQRSQLNIISKTVFNNLHVTSTYICGPSDVRRSKLYNSSLYTVSNTQKNSGIPLKYIKNELIHSQIPSNEETIKTLHTTASRNEEIKFDSLNVDKASKAFFDIKMNDLKQAPPSAFWLGMVGLIPFAFPPFQSVIFGYSPTLTTLQLAYGTAILSFVGGVKWGFLVPVKDQSSSWEKYFLSTVPCLVATISMVLPKLLAFPLVIIGFLGTFFIDLTSSGYPKWFLALRGILTNISVFFLLISFLQTLINFK